MKHLLFIFLLASLVSCYRTTTTEMPVNQRITSFEKLAAHFENPPAEYRTAPFWVWNNDVSIEDIDRTLKDFSEKGIGGVFVHPRYGMITEYLSDEWFELISYSLKKAEELGMQLWIYDENSFPSGFAGGHVAAQMPEANSEGIALKPHFAQTVKGPANIGRVKHIFKKQGESWIEVQPEQEEGKVGEYCLLELNNYETSKWFGGYSYVDILKPGVTEKFIEITMPGYENTLGGEFGKRVPGVFTDEPNTNTRSAGPVRYTPDLYEQFEKQWGYRLEPHLMSLITESGDWQKVRHNYQSVILRLFIERWSKPWHEYTEEKNLAWTGHYWEHGWPNPKEGPDNMAMYAWHQVPGIDMLFNSEKERPDQFGNIRNVKELSSVVNQFGRHRALSETYGAAGWELTFEDMKRLGDWEFALGVNLMNQHLSYISLAGDRKHDFPQSFGPYAPYWGVYKYQADYFARLSLALSSGFQKNNVLVIEPTTTAWMYYNPATAENSRMTEVKVKFENFLDRLERFRVEYDLGSENIIKDHGKTDRKKFVVNKAVYDKVILPPGLENLDQTTLELLKEFAVNGGKVIQMEEGLRYVNGQPYKFDELKKQVNWQVIADISSDLMEELSDNRRIRFENPSATEGRVFHMRREFDDGQLIFISNFDKEAVSRMMLEMEGKSVIELNPHTGSIEPYVYNQNGKNVQFRILLPPSGSRLLFVSENKGKSSEQEMPAYIRYPSTGKTTISALSPNILNLDYVELTLGNNRRKPMYFYTAANEIWKAHGFADNPWVSSSQFRKELVEADSFPAGSGFTVSYPFEVAHDFIPGEVRLVVERPWLYRISVNGLEISDETYQPWLDPDFHSFEIGMLLKPGRNEVEITASPFSIHAELQPVYLLGNFSLNSAEKGWKIVNKHIFGFGPWKEQGMPFYGQVVAYTHELEVKEEGDYALKLPRWEGTIAEVLIDGEHHGIIQTKADDVVFHLLPGSHEVTVKIAGSLKNTLGPHHNVKTRGIVTPWSFKFAPEQQPSGNEYDLLPYGLMQEMEFWRIELNEQQI